LALALIPNDLLDSEAFDLYNRARTAGTWSPANLIPGDASLAGDQFTWEQASRHVYAEQTGLSMAAQLLAEVDDAPLRLLLATAVSDEAKHCGGRRGGQADGERRPLL
jgi:hypothetical protein